MRRVQSRDATWYVNNGNGNDTNDGLSPGAPVKTIQRAIDIISYTQDMAGFAANIQIADGIYAEEILLSGAFVGNAQVSITGNLLEPEHVVLASAAGRMIADGRVAPAG